MSKFLNTFFLFCIPFFILLSLFFFIDPYNVFRNETNEYYRELKSHISYKITYPLYKLLEYSYNPTDIIILGDSRANKINSSLMESKTGKKTTNLAYGGGTIQDIIDTFWIVAKLNNLKQVYIGINFNLYNALNNYSRVQEADRIRKSALSYLTSKYCIKSAYFIIQSMITGQTIELEKPSLNKNDFWTYQLNIAGPNYYQNYRYPYYFYKELLKISNFCLKNNIKLILFIPPTHYDLQKK